ncbi:PhnD/SsuA/transferrin family substrate-binding protein [Azospirillum sp. RWY-5-1]|uniref:PhnD/SsuA/transferrin family substrate-binding protein n=1 Tax=Azospirillum oleiclasticum TaxID=2735135 RepID=A0ABX2TGC8_9PROT|nr:PhnD/SsuA/transferrin family substrate-binding protein [Azospirillum oleiclasticum]NYZ14826.1 PhnD/SsuA/transferrin family substrate-binding protein [Azospirillum oleiclasticum]NYZ22188.1 PhnD/SsuA/transferrin family substrate-binding protein [Azospirillum oleiclasticum]
MPSRQAPRHDAGGTVPCRRSMLRGLGAAILSALPAMALAVPSDASPLRIGLTPVFLDSDTELLTALERFLTGRLGRPVALVKRRTYQEITTLLLTGQVDAAWICGFPFVQFRDQLSLVAVPVYRGRPLYQSYVIAQTDGPAAGLDGLRGHVHAFSDPDSNSGFLVTRYLLAIMKETPASFFRRSFFTYGHRNVVRAVASGLAQSGSVDGYVWDVMAETEPGLVAGTRVLHRSDWLGFPPIACLAGRRDAPEIRMIGEALLGMPSDPVGRAVLRTLRLDGFVVTAPSLFDPIAAMNDFVRVHA